MHLDAPMPSKTVYLAEKPSQASDIATVLGIKRRGDGFIEVTGGDVVTFARGHLLELAEPQAYKEEWGGRWAWSQLPLAPTEWKYTVNRKTSGQLKTIKELLKDASRVVIATDAGREGELIARLILEHCRFKGQVDRFWTSSLTPHDIKLALGKLLPGAAKVPLFEAARARQHLDWAYGLSLTRAATLAADVRGNYFAVGRVQTPTLALVVRRFLEIQGFEAKPYFELEATVRTKAGKEFKMWHAPDEEHRIRDKAVADALAAKAKGANAPLSVHQESAKESPPLPFSLPKLQVEADRVLGFAGARTLEVAQKLYELKATTYPRTDCQHLAESQKDDVPGILRNLEGHFAAEVGTVKARGTVLRNSTFDDSKLTDHHGIIPTDLSVPLSGDEAKLFRLIAQRFLQTISPDCLFDKTTVKLDANGVPLKATGRVVTDPGWQAIKLP